MFILPLKIIVKARPRSKVEKVERITQPSLGLEKHDEIPIYKVSVKEPPENGKANDAIIRALSEYFDVSRSFITLLSGATSSKKIFSISSSRQPSRTL